MNHEKYKEVIKKIQKSERFDKIDILVYNQLCLGNGEPDSNIIEYAKDVLNIIMGY